jgi:5-methylcytosine-specific restriction enzyme subunit McrC
MFCEFDERTVDNPHNRALKFVLTSLLSEATGVHAKAAVGALLHRLDGVGQASVSSRDVERLPFDRLMRHWEPVFSQAKWLLAGLFPDVRAGDLEGTCLLFNMERVFESFIAVKMRAALRELDPRRFRLEYQGPVLDLATTEAGSAFALRPDIALLDGSDVIRIFDTKWKMLDLRRANGGISSADIYQLASYASRYQCGRVGLIYPAWPACPAGLVDTYTFNIPGSPTLEVYAIDLQGVLSGGGLADVVRSLSQELLSKQVLPKRRDAPLLR